MSLLEATSNLKTQFDAVTVFYFFFAINFTKLNQHPQADKDF